MHAITTTHSFINVYPEVTNILRKLKKIVFITPKVNMPVCSYKIKILQQKSPLSNQTSTVQKKWNNCQSLPNLKEIFFSLFLQYKCQSARKNPSGNDDCEVGVWGKLCVNITLNTVSSYHKTSFNSLIVFFCLNECVVFRRACVTQISAPPWQSLD